PAARGFTLPNVGLGIAGFIDHPPEGRRGSAGADDDVDRLIELVGRTRRLGPQEGVDRVGVVLGLSRVLLWVLDLSVALDPGVGDPRFGVLATPRLRREVVVLRRGIPKRPT